VSRKSSNVREHIKGGSLPRTGDLVGVNWDGERHVYLMRMKPVARVGGGSRLLVTSIAAMRTALAASDSMYTWSWARLEV
jgi:hypothetical protein